MKISDALQYSKNLFKHSSTPILDVELILAHVLKVDRVFLFLNHDFIISAHEKESFLAMLNKRILGTPVAYLIQVKDFWKSSFLVNKHTLIPRPDSETLIEAFCNVYKNKKINLNLAELGTGSGCIIISIVNEYKNIIGYGFEKMQQAFFITKKNVMHNRLKNRINVLYSNWNNIMTRVHFDVIISNPPYIKRGEIKNLDIEVAKYEPKVALDGGLNGLRAYEEIFKFSLHYLKNNGLVFFEIGNLQYKQVYLLGIKSGFMFYKVFNDLSGTKRVVVFKKMINLK